MKRSGFNNRTASVTYVVLLVKTVSAVNMLKVE